MSKRKQYVYRERAEVLCAESGDDKFFFTGSLVGSIFLAIPLLRTFGLPEGARRILRTAGGKRYGVYISHGGRVLAESQITIGRCKLYDVGINDVVIGPVWTDPGYRGRGYATRMLSYIVKQLGEPVDRVFWIDTEESNIAMQKAIRRAGYPAAEFVIDGDW